MLPCGCKLSHAANFQVSLSVEVWTKNISNITVWLPGVHVNLSVKCYGVFQIGIMYKALSTRIRTYLEPHIFYPDSCGGSLKPLLRAVSVSGLTGLVWTEGRFVWNSMRFQKFPDSSGRSQKEREYTSLMKFPLPIVVEDTKVQFSSV